MEYFDEEVLKARKKRKMQKKRDILLKRWHRKKSNPFMMNL